MVAHKLRLLLTTASIALGVAFLAGTLVLTDTMGLAFTQLFGKVSAGTDAVVRTEAPYTSSEGIGTSRAPIAASVLTDVSGVEGVRVAGVQLGSRLRYDGARLHGQPSPERLVGLRRLQDPLASEPRPPGRREARQPAQRQRHLVGHEPAERLGGEHHQPGTDPVTRPSAGLGRHGRQPFASADPAASARATTSTASSLPHQRQVTRSSVSARVSVSSITWSPARSKCQNSRVRRVRVTSNRVRFPQPPQRQRWSGPGTGSVTPYSLGGGRSRRAANGLCRYPALASWT